MCSIPVTMAVRNIFRISPSRALRQTGNLNRICSSYSMARWSSTSTEADDEINPLALETIPSTEDVLSHWSEPLVTQSSRRCPVFMTKLGMTQSWDMWGSKLVMTVLQVNDCQVVGHRTQEKDGYNAIILGAENKPERKTKGTVLGQYKKVSLPPKRHREEVKVTPDCNLPLGWNLGVEHFEPGQLVDVRGVTIGKGFAGVMKRHNFAGMPASHGQTKTHRRMGGYGGGQDPGRVWKGKRNAGRMGGQKRWQYSLMVQRMDTRYNLLYVRGSIPGAKGSRVLVRDTLMHLDQRPSFITRPIGTHEGKHVVQVLFGVLIMLLGVAAIWEYPPPPEDPYASY
eukprot:TRINITY_DN11960_c0_g1_i9.p2 TRINITY_DN11960_c0_g1~~TRINITY_DN11960_c0_g1_i9.p2  ORF type:complete len:340 (+),score=39.15 TRINITY_DN11960_c0_g1_i9:2025-3044(+)